MGTLAVEVVNLLQNFHMRFSDTQLRLRTDGTQVSSKYLLERVPYGYESYKKLRIRTTREYGAMTSELVPDNTPATHQRQTSSACSQYVATPFSVQMKKTLLSAIWEKGLLIGDIS